MGRGGHGVGTCAGTEGLCGDSTAVWTAAIICVRHHKGMLSASILAGSSRSWTNADQSV